MTTNWPLPPVSASTASAPVPAFTVLTFRPFFLKIPAFRAMKPSAWLALSDGMISVTLVSEAGARGGAAAATAGRPLEEPELLQAPTTSASTAAPTPLTRALRLVTFIPIAGTSIQIRERRPGPGAAERHPARAVTA